MRRLQSWACQLRRRLLCTACLCRLLVLGWHRRATLAACTLGLLLAAAGASRLQQGRHKGAHVAVVLEGMTLEWQDQVA